MKTGGMDEREVAREAPKVEGEGWRKGRGGGATKKGERRAGATGTQCASTYALWLNMLEL